MTRQILILAAEGGYQVFELRGGEWFWLIFSAATAILAILVGFVLVRGVLAADQGTPKMIEIADGDPGRRDGLPATPVPHDRLHPHPGRDARVR